MKFRVQKGLSDFSDPANPVDVFYVEVRYFGTWYIVKTCTDENEAWDYKKKCNDMSRFEQHQLLEKLYIK